MTFWLGVLVGGLFVVAAVDMGFYKTWIMFFNLLLSAYLAIFLTPVLIETIPAATTTAYGHVLTLVCIGLAAISLAYGLSFCVAGRSRIEFAKVVDTISAGLVGFLAGFLLWSFVALAFCLTPWSQTERCKQWGLDAQSQQTSTKYLCWWCDRLHCFVSAADGPRTTRQAVDALLEATAETDKP